MNGTPPNDVEVLGWKLFIEIFSVVISLSFLASAVFFFLVFQTWGENYFFLASGEDVVLGGLFVLITASSFTFFILLRELPWFWNFYAFLVVGILSFLIMIPFHIWWYWTTGEVFPGVVYILTFEDWTWYSILIGIVSTVALLITRLVKKSHSWQAQDLRDWTTPQFLLLFIVFNLSTLWVIGDQASAHGFLGSTPHSPKLAEFGCRNDPLALWAGSRFTVVRCDDWTILLPSDEIVLVSRP